MATRATALALLLVSLCGACGSDGSSDDASTKPPALDAPPAAPNGAAPDALILTFGDDVLPAVRTRITELLTAATKLSVALLDAKKAAVADGTTDKTLVLSFGETATGGALIDEPALGALGPEGFVVKSGTLGRATVIATAGNPPTKETAAHGNLGTAFGAYALLEELGFGFFHPLAPTRPEVITIPSSPIVLEESPRWRVRGMHLHTMHPLELTDLLQGWGKTGPNDETGWKEMLPEWDRFLEWMIANRQNRVEWPLLWADSWKDFADSAGRRARLATVVDHAHAWGISAGADAPLALQQQHTFRLVRKTGTLDEEKAQIDQRLDWLLGAGFDFFSTESGSTEFTHPEPARMLAWMNEAAQYSDTRWHVPTYIKAHCSTGQVADGYPDPKTGQPINFNFLPHHADKRLGIMPHTVQVYGLDDPAPTYGNTDFQYMREFLQQEVGTREVIWHPETAYWVTYDIDVPLFLPVYAERRVSDLRILAADEKAGRMGRGANAGGHMDGQMIFSSGWEWGYWLNDVVAARASWNPHEEASSSRDSLVAILKPLARVIGPEGADTVKWIADAADAQRALLVQGKWKSTPPSDIVQRNGMAYLTGFDAMADVASIGVNLGVSASPSTQPKRLGLVDMRNPLHSGPGYSAEIEPLLAAMESQFDVLASRAEGHASRANAPSRDLVDDLSDGARVVALRAKQVHGLYDYVDGWPIGDMNVRKARLAVARTALDQGAKKVAAREKRYRVDPERIAGWSNNPTAYEFRYLWFARTLYFWWRDEGKAVDAPTSPCYLNVMSPADIGLGEGIVADGAESVKKIVSTGVGECLAAPTTPPAFPQFGLRSRP